MLRLDGVHVRHPIALKLSVLAEYSAGAGLDAAFCLHCFVDAFVSTIERYLGMRFRIPLGSGFLAVAHVVLGVLLLKYISLSLQIFVLYHGNKL